MIVKELARFLHHWQSYNCEVSRSSLVCMCVIGTARVDSALVSVQGAAEQTWTSKSTSRCTNPLQHLLRTLPTHTFARHPPSSRNIPLLPLSTQSPPLTPPEPSAAMGLAPALEPIPNHVCVCAVPALRNSKAERSRQNTRKLLVDIRFSPCWWVRDKDRTGKRDNSLNEKEKWVQMNGMRLK